MTEPFHVHARKFLQEFFSDEELTNFCFDYFPQVYNDFTTGMPKSQKVRMLVESSRRRDRFDELLAALERERPKSYPDHFAGKPHLIDSKPQAPKTIERNPRQIFISHAHQDAEFAKRLAADLQANGWETWMAPDNIRPGEKWVEAINRGLAESSVFVLVITPESVNSRWVHTETNVAIGMEHRQELRLMPLNVKPTVTPALWEAYQWIAFDSKYEEGLAAFLEELDSRKVMLPLLTRYSQPPTPEKSEETGLDNSSENALTIQAGKPLSSEGENNSDQRQTIITQIKLIPSQVLYGGVLLLLITLMIIFWLDTTNTPDVEPTEVVELEVAENEEPESKATPSPSNSSTPTFGSTPPATVGSTPSPTSTETITATPSIIRETSASHTPTSTLAPNPTATSVRQITLSFIAEWRFGGLQLHEAACTEDSRFFVTSSSKYFYDLEKLEQVLFADQYTSGEGLAFSPDGQLGAFGAYGGDIHLIRISDGVTVRVLQGHTDYIRDVTFSTDGLTLASAANDGTMRLWNVADGELLHTLKVEGPLEAVPYTVAFHPNGEILATAPHGPRDGSEGYNIKLWNVSAGTLLETLWIGLSHSVSFSPDGSWLAAGLSGGNIGIYDVDDWSLVHTLRGGESWISKVTFSPNGELLAAAGSGDNVARLWNVETEELIYMFEGHEDFVSGVAFCPNGLTIGTSSWDGTVRLWSLEDGEIP